MYDFLVQDFELPEGTLGLTFTKDRIIVLNTRLGPEQARFTLAHELGHFFMGERTEHTVTRWFKEARAQSFAQHFLAPVDDVLTELERQGFVQSLTAEGWARADRDLGVIRTLARRYKVNATVVLLTLQDMGFIEDFAPWDRVWTADHQALCALPYHALRQEREATLPTDEVRKTWLRLQGWPAWYTDTDDFLLTCQRERADLLREAEEHGFDIEEIKWLPLNDLARIVF